jgi:hypothetical protein
MASAPQQQPYDRAELDRWAKVILFGEWTRQIKAGRIGKAYLLHIRNRLVAGNEFLPGADLDAMRIGVAEELARVCGVDPQYLSGTAASQVPDDPRELGD